MTEKKKILIPGISKFWGYGGYFHELGYEREELSDKNLSPEEYYQYGRTDNSIYLDSYYGNGPSKYIIHDLNKNVLICVKCKDSETEFEPCNNCSSKNIYGEVCKGCERPHQQARWVCSKCNCDNSITNTLFHWVEIDEIPYVKPIIIPDKKEGCFIATVCYGDYNSKEVLTLRQFRDEKLLNTISGRAFVNFYYLVSPFFAKQISKSDILKKSLRKYLLEPIVTILMQQNKL